ncbi:MAG: hypothetical protein IKM43_01665 [Clostridia bacterium]|nr:hypothetical protein [Clostridia bacterium]
MVKIDKTDALYKYLSGLNISEIDDVYVELAKAGRYKRADVQQYFQDFFRPSHAQDVEEKDLEMLVDYYADIKKLKKYNSTQLKQMLCNYKQTKDISLFNIIVNSQLKDVMQMCVNYSTMHKDINIQDLVQVANLGLITAVEKYDEQANIDFKDYIVYYVRKNIKKECEEKNNG